MKALTTVLLFLTVNANSQKVIHLITNNEVGVINYQLQTSSSDSLNSLWKTDYTILPEKNKSNEYLYPVSESKKNIFYRVYAQMVNKGSFYTTPLYIGYALSVDVTKMKVANKVFKWTSQNESNLKYYSIEESADGINFVETGRVYPKGDSDYKFTLK